MSWSSRRAVLVLTAVAVLGAASAVSDAFAQRPPIGPAPGPAPKPASDAFDLGSISLPKNDDVSEQLQLAVDNIRNRPPDYATAVEELHKLLERSDDLPVPITRKGPDGREIITQVYVKREVNRLLATLPVAGKAVYEARYGLDAAQMVKEARERNDSGRMAQAVDRFLHTESGPAAASWMGTYTLDRGDFRQAAYYFALLIQRQGIKAVSDKNLIKAAFAFHYSQQAEAKQQVFAELEARGNDLKMRDGNMTVANFRAYVDRLGQGSWVASATDFPMFGGGPGRSARLNGGPPFLERLWELKTVEKTAGGGKSETEQFLEKAEKALASVPGRVQPALTGFFPVIVTADKAAGKVPVLVYRTHGGVEGADLKTGKRIWRQDMTWGVDSMLGIGEKAVRDPARMAALTNWLNLYTATDGRPQAVLDNSVIGSLSADGKFVYAVEDLQVPPPYYQAPDPRIGVGRTYDKNITDAIHHNRLLAMELAKEGILKWEVGGMDDGRPLSETFFLGPPLPLAGRLFVLTEHKQKLSVTSLKADTGELIAQQLLGTVRDLKLEQDPFRRTQAAHLAYGEGILVVPTNAGAVFGLDVMSNSLVWAYGYREKGPNDTPPPRGSAGPHPGWRRLPNGEWVRISGLDGRWKTTAPVVQDGKVVFAAPDAKSIHCINVRDGSPVWSRSRRDDDLYLGGVFNGKVVVVGKGRAYGLSLSSGEVLWDLETGLPSGHGAAAPLEKGVRGNTIYYLPLKSAVRTGEPEICAINVDRGLIHAHARSRKKDVPGNLLFFQGRLISQTATAVVAYPNLDVKLDELNQQLAKAPNDAAKLAERGDFLLDKGDLHGAILDFRKALRVGLAGDALAQARAKLYDAFTEYFQRDFDAAEKYLTEYEELCKVDLGGAVGVERTAREAEGRRRRANFLCLVGKGREAQNRLVDAFEKYLELGETGRRDELIQVVDEPSVRAAPDVWSQGRIAAMAANARDAKQSKALEGIILARWKKLQATPGVPTDDLRKFVKLFGSTFGVGKEARLALAERLMEDDDLGSLLEAEQQLNLLRGPGEAPEVAARAVEALARLYTRKGFLEDAAFFYRLLGEKYGRVVVANGKTGADFLEDLTTDKRFLPYLDPPLRFTIRGKAGVKVTDQKVEGSAGYMPPTYQFAHEGERLPFFERSRLGLISNDTVLRLASAATGDDLWKLDLKTRTPFQQIANDWRAEPFLARHTYQTLGHLVVLQVGHVVFAIDPQNKGRVLWERSLLAPDLVGQMPTSYSFDPKDGSVHVLYANGYMYRLGQAGPLQGAVVCLLTRDALTAVDPVTGRTLWTRNDVNSRSVVFGDESNIYVVGMGDGNNATGTRAFRAYDGVSVRLRDFTNEYQNRVRMLGRNILVAEVDIRNALNLRIYDVLAGRNLWEQKFPAGSILLRSEDPRLAGAIEPDGTLRVVDLTTTREVLKAKLKSGKIAARDLDKAKSVHLVSDANAIYVAVNGPDDPSVVRMTWMPGMPSVQPLLASGFGLRALPVNGDLYAFRRDTGALLWVADVANSMLTLAHFEDMPVVLLTGRYNKREGVNTVAVNTINVINKRNGKYVFARPDPNESTPLPPGISFHALQMDARTGRFELLGNMLKIVIQVARSEK
jgi:outer membrane protein assembly factor BamB/tetratricopeptide (TPR) repeat protein